MHIGQWTKKVNITIIPMDDYSMVLGMEFHDMEATLLVPYANTMCIM